VVFLGSGAFGVPTLEAIARQHELLAVVTQPDKPAGRGMKLTPTPVANWAAQHAPAVPLLKPDDVNQPQPTAQLRALKADAWVVIAFGQKLSPALLEGVFAINLHASVLPRWRGAAPINAAILAGDSVTGNSVITLADRMDAGLVLGTSTRPIDPLVTAGELHDQLGADGPRLVLDVLARHAAGTLAPQRQDEARVTKAKKLKRADGAIDWSKPAQQCRWLVHGLTPWPGVSVAMPIGPAAPMTIKILRVRDRDGPAAALPGTITDPAAGLIACGTGALQILEIQPAGGRAMPWEQFVRGRPVIAGTVVGPDPGLAQAGNP
jgi:methionyl-tRNA formyltransferase